MQILTAFALLIPAFSLLYTPQPLTLLFLRVYNAPLPNPLLDCLSFGSFTYELGLIAKLLRPVSQRFTLEGHNAELWDETARRFEHVAPVELELLPADSMPREFYAGEV